ncbi:glycosyltransferase family 2 protein [Jejuia pallidilutea]|nr:glycosyl transferase family 2 [Jejuia pallidilutea]
MKNIEFSLVICTYMRPNALVSLLNSVNAQSLYPDEIIIVDGSLNEDTKNILLKNDYQNLNYFKVDKTHRGLTKQRNFGVKHCSDSVKVICF